MKAYRFERQGQPGATIVARDVDVPNPGPTQVLVRIHARSLNFRDILIMQGRYPVPSREGVIPLSDGAGEVVAVGEKVQSIKVGDRVTTVYFPRWRSGLFDLAFVGDQFGCTRDGVLADFVVAEEDGIMPFPAHLSFREAATLPCAGVMAWAALSGPRPVLPGDTVMTLGSGGVALFALQFAKMFGARTIVVTGSMERAGRLADVGADEVVRRDDDVKWVQTVRDLTGGRGGDHIVETGSMQTLAPSMACGHEGAVTTVIAATEAGGISTSILARPMLLRRIYVGSRAHLAEMNRAIALHRMRPVIDACYEFDAAAAALRRFGEHKSFGKIVIADAERG